MSGNPNYVQDPMNGDGFYVTIAPKPPSSLQAQNSTTDNASSHFHQNSGPSWSTGSIHYDFTQSAQQPHAVHFLPQNHQNQQIHHPPKPAPAYAPYPGLGSAHISSPPASAYSVSNIVEPHQDASQTPRYLPSFNELSQFSLHYSPASQNLWTREETRPVSVNPSDISFDPSQHYYVRLSSYNYQPRSLNSLITTQSDFPYHEFCKKPEWESWFIWTRDSDSVNGAGVHHLQGRPSGIPDLWDDARNCRDREICKSHDSKRKTTLAAQKQWKELGQGDKFPYSYMAAAASIFPTPQMEPGQVALEIPDTSGYYVMDAHPAGDHSCIFYQLSFESSEGTLQLPIGNQLSTSTYPHAQSLDLPCRILKLWEIDYHKDGSLKKFDNDPRAEWQKILPGSSSGWSYTGKEKLVLDGKLSLIWAVLGHYYGPRQSATKIPELLNQKPDHPLNAQRDEGPNLDHTNTIVVAEVFVYQGCKPEYYNASADPSCSTTLGNTSGYLT